MGIKYDINRGFFATWSQEMSYVLGFIAADGSLEDASYLRGKYIRICSSDLEILEKIRAAMNSKHTIVHIKPKEFTLLGKKYTSKERHMLRIGSHAMYGDLVALGITPAKSKSIKFPPVPREFFASFIRGYFDGDGCVNVYEKQNRLSVTFTSGSQVFLEQLSRIISIAFGAKTHNVFSNSRAFQIKYSTREAIPLLRHLYRGARDNLFLERKHKTYINFLSANSRWQKENSDIGM